MRYLLLTDDAPGDLSDEVNRMIADGWRPLGGASVAVAHHPQHGTLVWYTQAVVNELLDPTASDAPASTPRH